MSPTPGPGRPSSRPGLQGRGRQSQGRSRAEDARLEGVGLGHSSEETGEQSSGCAVAESAERRAGRNGSSQQAKHGPDTEPDFPRHRRLRDTAVPKGCRHDRSEEPGALAGTPGSARGASGNRRPTATVQRQHYLEPCRAPATARLLDPCATARAAPAPRMLRDPGSRRRRSRCWNRQPRPQHAQVMLFVFRLVCALAYTTTLSQLWAQCLDVAGAACARPGLPAVRHSRPLATCSGCQGTCYRSGWHSASRTASTCELRWCATRRFLLLPWVQVAQESGLVMDPPHRAGAGAAAAACPGTGR